MKRYTPTTLATCLLLVAPILTPVVGYAEVNATATNSTGTESVVSETTKINEVNATERMGDLRILITHEDEDKFTLDLILMPKEDPGKETLDKRIDKFFKPLADTIGSIVFWHPTCRSSNCLWKTGLSWKFLTRQTKMEPSWKVMQDLRSRT